MKLHYSSLILFFGVAMYLMAMFVQKAALATIIPDASPVIPLNLSYSRIGIPIMCYGLYDCWTKLCITSRLPKVSYIALRQFERDSICSYSYWDDYWYLNEYRYFGVSQLALLVACIIEIIGMCLDNHLRYVSRVFLVAAYVLFFVAERHLELATGNFVPQFIVIWNYATSTVLLISTFFSIQRQAKVIE